MGMGENNVWHLDCAKGEIKTLTMEQMLAMHQLEPPKERYIIVELSDYLLANNGKIAPDKEVVFTTYSSGTYRSSGFVGVSSHYTSSWGETVTHVRKWKDGYRGTNGKGKRVDCEERNASLHLPLSYLKEPLR